METDAACYIARDKRHYYTYDIIDTMVFRLGIQQGQMSPSTAVGLLKSGVSLFLISLSYYIADKKFDYKIF